MAGRESAQPMLARVLPLSCLNSCRFFSSSCHSFRFSFLARRALVYTFLLHCIRFSLFCLTAAFSIHLLHSKFHLSRTNVMEEALVYRPLKVGYSGFLFLFPCLPEIGPRRSMFACRSQRCAVWGLSESRCPRFSARTGRARAGWPPPPHRAPGLRLQELQQ